MALCGGSFLGDLDTRFLRHARNMSWSIDSKGERCRASTSLVSFEFEQMLTMEAFPDGSLALRTAQYPVAAFAACRHDQCLADFAACNVH